jgi:hypothetical protein
MAELFRHLDDEDRIWLVPVGMTPVNAAACRGCRQLVLWVITPNGKRAPFNAVGTNHFATCPKASSFRVPEEPPGWWDAVDEDPT